MRRINVPKDSGKGSLKTAESGRDFSPKVLVLVLLSQDLPSPFGVVRFTRFFLQKGHSV